MRLFSSFVLLSLCISTSSWAALKPVASVVKMRGSVTKLMPGALEATAVSADDKFPEDTSIVTGPKSFIKIKFIDNSELNMGPESKIVIAEMARDSVGIISLLKGRIRTEVEKAERAEDRQKNKFFIRTRTAAMGVRGTDFQTIYNPENRVTSLLTYKGSVAMAKIDETTHQKFENKMDESTTTIERDDVTKAPEVNVVPSKPLDEESMLTKVLSEKSTVMVKPGQNAMASDALKKTSAPVTISPVQLNALYKNREFNEKNILNLKSGNEQKDVKLDIVAEEQKAPEEGYYNAKTGEYAPKAGGFIDQKTGLYVAPVAENTGDFDADTGDYFAPQGLVLDPKKGFVIDKNAEVKPELLAMREDLNRSIARDAVVGDLDGEVVIAAKTLREKFIRDRVTFTVGAGTEKIKLNEGSNSNPFSEARDKGAMDFSILWQLASTNRFAPLIGLSYSRVGYESLGSHGDSQDSKSLFTMSTGLKYALTNTIDLAALVLLDQNHYANQQVLFPNTYIYKRVVVTKATLGANIELARSNRFSLMGDVFGALGFRKRFNNLVISDVSGFNLKLTPQFNIDEKRVIGVGVFLAHEKATLTNNVNSNEQKRNSLGAELKFSTDI